MQDGLGNRSLVDYAPLPMRLLCVSLFALLITPALLGAQAKKPQVKVTAVFDGPSPVFDDITEDLAREIRTQPPIASTSCSCLWTSRATGPRRAWNVS